MHTHVQRLIAYSYAQGVSPVASRALSFTYRRYVGNQDESRLSEEGKRGSEIRRLSESRRIKINRLPSRYIVRSDGISRLSFILPETRQSSDCIINPRKINSDIYAPEGISRVIDERDK